MPGLMWVYGGPQEPELRLKLVWSHCVGPPEHPVYWQLVVGQPAPVQLVQGTSSDDSGSATAATPVVAVGLTEPPLLTLMPPLISTGGCGVPVVVMPALPVTTAASA